MKRIAIFGANFDPPSQYHRMVVEKLTNSFDEVHLVPCVRPYLVSPTDSSPMHRAAMVDLNFQGIPKAQVQLFDLEGQSFTPPFELEKIFGRSDDRFVTHVVHADLVRGGKNGQARIQRQWTEGERVWHNSHFTILCEADELDPADAPPHAEIMIVPPHITSNYIRGMIFNDDAVDAYLMPKVESYIRRHGLFRGTPLSRETRLRLHQPPRFKFFFDPSNPESVRLKEQLQMYESPDPEMIVVMGGDGTMLRAIRQHWRERIPIFGLNTGHLGFLLNDKNQLDFWQQELMVYQLSLLFVETVSEDGERKEFLAFNDTWVERSTGQTAWIEVSVNDVVRLPKVVADGMLVSTAAGSTSYASAMGASPVPFNTPVLLLAGSNVLIPNFWRPAVMPMHSKIRFRTLDMRKRPLRCYVDGETSQIVESVTIRRSNIASVELVFTPSHDPTEKLYVRQFSME